MEARSADSDGGPVVPPRLSPRHVPCWKCACWERPGLSPEEAQTRLPQQCVLPSGESPFSQHVFGVLNRPPLMQGSHSGHCRVPGVDQVPGAWDPVAPGSR